MFIFYFSHRTFSSLTPQRVLPLPTILRSGLPALLLFLTFSPGGTDSFAQGLIDPDPRWEYPQFLGFRPADGRSAEVNPPRFSWPYRPEIVGAQDEARRLFRFQLDPDPGFPSPVVDVEVDYNFYNTLEPVAPGTWYWRVGYDHEANGSVDEWSSVRSFSVSGNEPVWDRSGHALAESLLAATSGSARPRFGPVDGDWDALRVFLENSPQGAGWLAQLLDQANRITGQGGYAGRPWYTNPSDFFPPTDEDGGALDEDGIIDGKVSFATGQGIAEWRSNDFGRAAQNLVIVAFAHRLTGDPAYAGARELLLQIAAFPHTPHNRSLSWPEFHGATTKQTTPITEYLALLYDWYYDDLTPAERTLVRESVARRVRQVFLEGRSWRSDAQVYQNGVGIRTGSHQYQNFFWTLPGLLLLAGEDNASDAMMETESLLPLTLDFLTGVTAGALYGPDDGAINEGVGYGAEKQGTLLRTALLAEILLPLGQDKNPFYAGHQRWLSHALFSNYQRSPFGDQWNSDLRNDVLLNQKALTLLTGNPRAKTRWQAEVNRSGNLLELGTFSRPWTILLAYQHRQDAINAIPEPEEATALFPESGWVMAARHAPTTETLADNGPRMLFQSRPRGGHSHSYRAENTFAWHAYGEALAVGAGSRRYPDPYSRHTMSHNAILINGQGQEWTDINMPERPFMGRLLAYEEGILPEGGSYVHWVGDATNAYPARPGEELERWHRHVLLIDETTFVIYDDLKMKDGSDPALFSWLLQVDQPDPPVIQISGADVTWSQNAVQARVVFNRPADDLHLIHQSGSGAIPDPEYPSGSGWAPDWEGNHVFVNPITGENLLPAVIHAFEGTPGSGSFAGSTRFYFSESEYPEQQRTRNTLWVTNAEPAYQWQLLTALLAWPEENEAPEVVRLDDHRMEIHHSSVTRTLSFDPTQPGDLTIDPDLYRAHAGETVHNLPVVSVRRSTPSVRENSGATPSFIIERSRPGEDPLTVFFQLTGTALPSLDYIVPATESLTIPGGADRVLLPVALLDNPVLEGDKTIILHLLPHPDYGISLAQSTITIRDDEALRPGVIAETMAPNQTRTLVLHLANPFPGSRPFALHTGPPAEDETGWTAASFIDHDPTPFLLDPRETVSLILTLDSTGLSSGNFLEILTIVDMADGSLRTIPAYLTISPNPPPAAPEKPHLDRLMATEVALTWVPRSTDESGFRVERRLASSDPWEILATLPDGTTNYTDTPAPDGVTTRSSYRIVAFNAHGETASPHAVTGLELPAPTGVTAVAQSPFTFAITWDYSGQPTDAFHVERALTPEGPWFPVGLVRHAENSLTDTRFDTDIPYFYRVTAFDEELTSLPSAITESIPLPPAVALTLPRDMVYKTEETFTATLTRDHSQGDQWVELKADSPHLSLPSSIIIPDGEQSVSFSITIEAGTTPFSEDPIIISAHTPQALIGESFPGPADSILSGQNTGWGWGAAWTHHNTSPVLKEPSLLYENKGVISTPGTRAARFPNTGQLNEGRRVFPAKFNEGSIWISTLLDREGSQPGTQMIIRENPGGGNWARIRFDGATTEWRLEAGAELSAQLYAGNPQGTLLLVMHFDFDTRLIHAYLSPEVNHYTPTNALGTATIPMQAALSGISRLDIAGRSLQDGFDAIRVARSYPDLYRTTVSPQTLLLIDDEALPPPRQWRLLHFGTHLPDGDAAWEADPDGDGIPNLLEYALGGDPHQPFTAQPWEKEFADQSLKITFFRAVDSLTYIVEFSEDLVLWEPLAINPGVAGEWISVHDEASPATTPRRFLRLRVSE